MPVAAMNHFTVLSDDLEATRRFYCDLFGFKVGWRPPFQFPGWWLYADDDTPILHVIHSKDLPPSLLKHRILKQAGLSEEEFLKFL